MEDFKISPSFPWLLCHRDGSIFSKKSKRFLTKKTTRNGYVYINLYVGGVFAHRIVADAFLGPIPNGLEVNHINGVKSDNRPENLEYVTKSENAKHAHKTKLATNKGINNPRAKLNREAVEEIKRLRLEGLTFVSIAKMFGVAPETVSMAYRNKTWQ